MSKPYSNLLRLIFLRLLLLGLSLIAVGSLLWIFFPSNSPVLQKLLPRVIATRWGLFLAMYCFTMAASPLIIHPLMVGMRYLFNTISQDELRMDNLWPSLFVGFCEAVLYPSAFLMGKPEFIGVWLAVKVAGQWNFWSEDFIGRKRFQMFLIGSALSLIVCVLSFTIIKAFVLAG